LDDDDEEAAKKKEELNRENIDVISYLETVLSGKVEKVTVSPLLTDSPAALVQGAYGMSPSMQRYMKAQSVALGQDISGLDSMNKVCMEINAKHPIIKDLGRMIKADKESKETEDFAKLLFDVAGMTSGYDIEDMSSFAKRVMGLMSSQVAEAVPDAEVTETVSKIEKEVEEESKPKEEEIETTTATDVEVVE
jgi:heat shock protein beta